MFAMRLGARGRPDGWAPGPAPGGASRWAIRCTRAVLMSRVLERTTARHVAMLPLEGILELVNKEWM